MNHHTNERVPSVEREGRNNFEFVLHEITKSIMRTMIIFQVQIGDEKIWCVFKLV